MADIDPVISYTTGDAFGWETHVYQDGRFGLEPITPGSRNMPFRMTRDEMTDLRMLIDDALNTSADEIGN